MLIGVLSIAGPDRTMSHSPVLHLLARIALCFSSKKGVCTHLFLRSWRTNGCLVFCVFFPFLCLSRRTWRSTQVHASLPVFFSSLLTEILAGIVPALDLVIVRSLDERDLETPRNARGLGISCLRRDVQEPNECHSILSA